MQKHAQIVHLFDKWIEKEGIELLYVVLCVLIIRDRFEDVPLSLWLQLSHSIDQADKMAENIDIHFKLHGHINLHWTHPVVIWHESNEVSEMRKGPCPLLRANSDKLFTEVIIVSSIFLCLLHLAYIYFLNLSTYMSILFNSPCNTTAFCSKFICFPI